MIKELIVKACSYYREHGFSEFVRRLHWRTTYVLFCKAAEVVSGEMFAEGVSFRVASNDDIPLIANLQDRHQPCQAPHDLAARIRAGELVVLGVSVVDPPKVMYVSVASSNNRFFHLLRPEIAGADDVCSHGIWVPAVYRGHGIAYRGLRYIECEAAQCGVRRLWAFVKTDNTASLGLHRRLGYEEVGLFRAGRWFGKRVAAVRPAGKLHWRQLIVPETESQNVGNSGKELME